MAGRPRQGRHPNEAIAQASASEAPALNKHDNGHFFGSRRLLAIISTILCLCASQIRSTVPISSATIDLSTAAAKTDSSHGRLEFAEGRNERNRTSVLDAVEPLPHSASLSLDGRRPPPSQQQQQQQQQQQPTGRMDGRPEEKVIATKTILLPLQPDFGIIGSLNKTFGDLNNYTGYFSDVGCVPTVQFQLTIQTVRDRDEAVHLASGDVATDRKEVHGKRFPNDHAEASTAQPPSPRLVAHQTTRYTIQALDEHGQPKTVGGDEFYPVYYDEKQMARRPKRGSLVPSAVAHVNDNGDGTYALHFEAPPYEAPVGSLHGRGFLKLHYAFTCGMARLTRPAKDHWRDGGSLFATYTIHNLTMSPEIHPFGYPSELHDGQQQAGSAVDLASYDRVICCGDSILVQLCGTRPSALVVEFLYKNVRAMENFGSLFRHDSWQQLVPDLLNTTYGEDLAIASDADKRVAVIINSAAWEILSEKIPPQDNNFTSSMRMYREVITWFRQSYPNVTLIWKLPQAFHLHAADAVHARPAQVTRLKHASIANAKYLHGQQRALMEELGVPVLDLWNASYLSGHRHRNGDAVHYETQQNHYFIDMYYIDPKMKQLGKHRRERGRIL